MNVDQAVALIERDVDFAPQDAVVYAISRAQLARAVKFALEGKRREAKAILDAEAETGLIGTHRAPRCQYCGQAGGMSKIHHSSTCRVICKTCGAGPGEECIHA